MINGHHMGIPAARYLVRFDDICPTMNWQTWEAIEEILEANQIQPILAVVPDNQDKELQVAPAVPDFWDRVRAWQRRGWTIGMHGYRHCYVTRSGGIMGVNRRSEFAGLPYREQESKLRSGLEIFHRENISPDIWIAPGHSFDATTVTILRDLGVSSISDGWSVYPHVDTAGVLWIPQQLWSFRRAPFGVWTVCLHHNSWTASMLGQFHKAISDFRSRIAKVEEVIEQYKSRRRSWLDVLSTGMMQAAFIWRPQIRAWLVGA